MSNSEHRPKPKNLMASAFDAMPPLLAQNMSAKDHVTALKESRWNNDYQTEYQKNFLAVNSIDDIVYSDHRCSIANALVIRYVLPDFIKNKGLNIDKIVTLENDGEYAGVFASIEIAPGKKESRLIYGNYLVSNDTQKYIIHTEEGYQGDHKFRIASTKDATPDAHLFMEELLKYASENNFLKGKKIDPKCNFINFDKKYDWNDIVLPEKIKDDVRRNLLNLIESHDIYKKNGLQVKRGLILSSDPGTGKSTLVKILCNQISWSLVWATPKHLGDAKQVAQIIELCKELSPTVLVLEDIDLYGGSREMNHNPALLGEMMNQLDGVQDNTDIITIATTNNKEVLDKALLNRPGRFDKVIDVPLPDVAERLKMIKVFSNGLVDENMPYLLQIAKEDSNKFTGAKVRELVNMAILFAVDEKSYDANQKIIVTEMHFKKAAATVNNKDFSKITGFNPTGASSSLGSRFDDMCLDD
jgi:cell division protease FtsH